MATLTTQADAVRSAVASLQTCTPTISATLKDLLQGDETDGNHAKPSSTRARTTKAAPATKAKSASSTARKTQTKAQPAKEYGEGLSSKEKAVLATQVINATLKSLGDAAKNPSVAAPAARQAPRNGLRRSNSTPMTPLQPRSLNRVSTSPAASKISRSPAVPAAATAFLATVECARVAFSTLRTLSSSGKVVLPELQLESGMSSLVNKLIALNLYEHALKELRQLKRRLESLAAGGKKTKTAANSEFAASSKTISDLFDYPTVKTNGPVLALIITSQLQALRILYGLKKSSHLDTAVPYLVATHPSSPLALLLLSLKDEKADKAKCARQLESLAQSLLSLPPSVSSKDDGVAVEPRLSPSPETSIQIQGLGLVTRLHSWSLSGHKGNVDTDILLPLSRCLSAYKRRSSSDPASKLGNIESALSQVQQKIGDMGLKASELSKSPLAAIYQELGTASRDAGNIKQAISWMKKLKGFMNSKEDSAAFCCSVTAQLLALSLKQSTNVDETLINEVLDGLQGPLSGSTTELDELLVSICLVRKASISFVIAAPKSGEEPNPRRDLLQSLILQLPRFAMRWLGKLPASGSATKDFLRFEQRRQLLSKYIQNILDSTLMLTKVLLDQGKMPWDMMDPILLDSLAVLENMGDLALNNLKNNPSASYHVKISHFYYQQHVILRQGTNSKDSSSLRALRRSIDAVKNQSEAEQVKAQLLTKQERLAELCRASGRKDDAADALRSIRDSLVREEIVTGITTALSGQGVLQAWSSNPKAESLSRTVCSLAKIDYSPCDWTWLLTGLEKVTALEHDLYFVYSSDAKTRKQLSPGEPLVDKILEAFTVDEFPIRRLRTLLQLLLVNLESRDEVGSWLDEAKLLSESLGNNDLGQDSGLAHYITHLQALTTCLVSLFERSNSPMLKQALATWSTVTKQCQTLDELYAKVDNPSQLVTCLQGLADFSRMTGLDGLLGVILHVSADISKLISANNPELLVSQNNALCLQQLVAGQSLSAEKVLEATQEVLSQQTISSDVVTSFHLCSAEYNMAIGNFDQAEVNLANAHASATAQSTEKHARSSRLTKKLSIAYASFLHSNLALERGNSHHALYHAKLAVRILFHDWAKLESIRGVVTDQGDEVSQTEVSEDETSFSSSRSSQSEVTRANTGPEFWAMAHHLFRFVTRLSWVYAHIGMYQETMYYAEQAQKVAASMESASYITQSKAWLASVFATAGRADKALVLASEVKAALSELEPTCPLVDVTCRLSRIFRDNGDHDTESELMNLADLMLNNLSRTSVGPDALDIEVKMEKLSIQEKPAVKAGARQPRGKTTAAAKKTTAKKAAPVRAKTLVEPKPAPTASEDKQLLFLRASLLQHQSSSMLDAKDWSAAVTALQGAYELSKLSSDVTQERLLMAVALVGQSLEQMGRDSVFSVIQDSTLSFPAIAGSKEKADRAASAKSSPPPKKRAASPTIPTFLDNLQQAQDYLLEAHSIACLNGNGALVQRIAVLLQNVFILLSTTNSGKSLGYGHPAHATCSIELARNLIWRRERKAHQVEPGKAEWPVVLAKESRRASLGVSIDMNRFQREYVDIIPKSWNVVSVSLSDNQHDLCITKLQAGHSPFAIRLPLERAMSRDADSEVFNFQQGRAELLEIIEIANRTCHDARDMSAKGAKAAWWAEREALDLRMKELLDNMEETWLGGFKGIFAQHHRRSDLLAKFQKSFQNILDKHLPSRHQVRGKRTKAAAGAKVSLDPRILDLFIGLGDATVPECDLDDPLTDLLYFVVDILQFHGERNAYDEIDFDSMVVDTFDALQSYHAAANSSKDRKQGVHTILVLDKALHTFPWESMPCMQGLAVSRIASLDCLRRSILEQQCPRAQSLEKKEKKQAAEEVDEEVYSDDDNGVTDGHHISLRSGTYMLNPSGDLTSTQATFARPLASLPPAWTSIEGRAPTEDEFAVALTRADLLLYFGHGSGAQYVRGRTIRRLAPRCRAVTLLMGCSSASLADVGGFEPHGPVWNYMLAGSPAVVGTLWDVTDRDIDRYAGRLFEEWGVMPRGTFAEDAPASGLAAKGAKGKGKAKAASGKGKGRKARGGSDEEDSDVSMDDADAAQQASLVEAVARSRDACKFRYLTAAAVVVYGIPVYISK
jgi:separase